MMRKLVPIWCLSGLYLSTAVSAAETENPESYAWSEEHMHEPLNLTGYVLKFADEFDQMNITDENDGGVWIAPGHSDVGASTWDKVSARNGVYTVANGVLKIRAFRAADGKWHAGNIQTVDSKGNGFSQRYGYFEANIKFPTMAGAWCAFWLKSQTEHVDRSITRPEIDVVEWYGGDPKGHHQTVHLWPAAAKFITPGRLTKHWYRSNYTGMPEIGVGWHTHGVLVTPEFVIMYVDRKEVARFATLYEFQLPLYPLVSLTLYEKDVAKAISPFEMEVDYVRIYSRDFPNAPVIDPAE